MANIINGTDTGSGGLITTGDSSDELQLQTAEVARVTLTNTAVVVNESGADVDFRVESDTVDHALFVEGSSGNVGIGTSTPKLNGNAGTFLSVVGTNANGWLEAGTTSQTDGIGGALTFNNTNIAGSDKRTAQISSGRAGADNTAYLSFATNNAGTLAERIRILSSGGITFNGDTAAANALDDYEEGTWTPAWSNGGGSPTYTAASTVGSYTKIGNMCAAWGVVTSSALTQSANGIHITLPFTVKNQQSSYGAVSIFPEDGINPAGGAGNMYGLAVIGFAAFQLYTIASGTGNNYTALTFNDLQASAQTRIRFCVVFEVA